MQVAQNEISEVMKSSRGAVISAFLFSAIVNVLMLAGPLFMLQIYDRVLTSGSVQTLVALTVIVVATYLYYGFLEYVRARILVRIGRRFEETLRPRVFDAVAASALRPGAKTGSQPFQDLASMRQFLGGSGPLAFLDMPWVPFYLAVVFAMHWMLGVAALVAAVLIFGLAVLTELSSRGPMSRASQSAAKAALLGEEARRNAEAMHAMGMRAALRNRWEQLQQLAMDEQTTANDAGGLLGAMSRVVRLMVQSGLLALGAWLAIKQEITPGTIIASSIIMGRALAPVEQAVGNWQQFLGFRKARERLTKILAEVPVEINRMALPRPSGLLQVENVISALPNVEKPLLQGINFTVQPGQALGIIGPTGAGKSTLARILVGLQPPTRGYVRLDNAALEQRSVEELGKNIGYLPQDVQLFDGTVAQNISRFAEKPNPDEIVNAAKMANVHELVMRLPQGYDTPLQENGSRLSVGQRQRVALARALFGEPALLVLDEPNSNLDADGEVALINAMRKCLERNAAVVVIAHRPSAMAFVHNIIVLADGKIHTQGPRDEILRAVMTPPQQRKPQMVISSGAPHGVQL